MTVLAPSNIVIDNLSLAISSKTAIFIATTYEKYYFGKLVDYSQTFVHLLLYAYIYIHI